MIGIRHIVDLGKSILPLLLVTMIVLSAPPASAGNDWRDRNGIRDLLFRLAGDDRSVRTAAALELRTYGQDILPSLMKAYRSGDDLERRGAVIGLTLVPEPALGSSVLLDALADDDLTARSLAAHGLALVGVQAAPWLAGKLADPDQRVRDAAAFGLRLMGARAVPALTRALKTEDEFALAKAAWLLGRLGPAAESAVPALVRTLDARDDRAMHVAAEAIDLIGPDPAITIFHLTQLGAGDTLNPTRKIGSNAAPTLVKLLSRPGTPLAQLAFRTLANMGPEAETALKHAVDKGTPGQQVAAALLLVEIDPNAVRTLPEDIRTALTGAKRQHTK